MRDQVAPKKTPSVAILGRTNRSLAPVEQALSAAEIPFHYLNRSGFFAQPEVISCLAYLGASQFPANYLISQMLISDFHPTKFLPKSKLLVRLKELKEIDDKVSYWQLMTKEPRTLVEPRNLESLQHFTQFVSSLSRYRDHPPAEALKQILGALKVGDYYAEFESIDNDPLMNLNSLVKMASKYRTIKEFSDFCRRVAAASKKRRGVILSTIHGFKGAEADVVYIVGVSDGVLPHSKSTDLEEERCIWFVGCSRPRRELIVTYSGVPSVFLKTVREMDKEK